MSIITEVLGRAMSDAAFRTQLLAAPEQALAGYDLTDEQRTALSGLTAEGFDAFAADLEQRLSKTMFSTMGAPAPDSMFSTMGATPNGQIGNI